MPNLKYRDILGNTVVKLSCFEPKKLFIEGIIRGQNNENISFINRKTKSISYLHFSYFAHLNFCTIKKKLLYFAQFRKKIIFDIRSYFWQYIRKIQIS